MVEVDICVPAFGDPLIVEDCLKHIHDCTGLPYRLIVANDGMGGEMTDAVRAWMREHVDVPSVLLNNKARAYFTSTCNMMACYGNAAFVAFVHPYVGLFDKMWLEKLLTIMRQDARARCVAVDPTTKWNQNPPYCITSRHPPVPRGLTMFRRVKSPSVSPLPVHHYWPEVHPHDSLFMVQKQVGTCGEHFWVAPNIRTIVLHPDEGKLHDNTPVEVASTENHEIVMR